jgi:hypothetical protein
MAKVSNITKVYNRLIIEGERLLSEGQYRDAINKFDSALVVALSLNDDSCTKAYRLLYTSVRFLFYYNLEPIDLMSSW